VQSRFAACIFTTNMFTTRMFVLGLCLFAAFAPHAIAQRQSIPPPPPVRGDPNTPPITDADAARDRLTAEMAKKAAKDRAAALKSDTDKLLKLSVELKQSVDKSGENVLSLDVIKKAEEIEKLARSVKEKMKGPS
jgi:hypothetical protein